MTSKDIRDKFIKFFVDRGHKEIAPSKLVSENDSTTLFTGFGMQQLVPYLKGEVHPQGKRLVDSQPCFRAEDIEEVGDNRHTTFFEMLGNWSLGDYFKKEQLSWLWEFLTKELGLPKQKLYVSVFEGDNQIPRDEESAGIWKDLGVAEDHIYFYGVSENWWSRAGPPDQMPEGEIGGPDSEVFFDFYPEQGPIGKDLKIYSHNGRLLEIGNSVFIKFQKEGGKFKELPQKNVDFGGGLERLVAATENEPDIFEIDLFQPIVHAIEDFTDKKYSDTENQEPIRVIADHMRAAVSLISDGVQPSNKLQGYVLRRLIRRAAVKMHKLRGGLTPLPGFSAIAESVGSNKRDLVEEVIKNEVNKFGDSLDRGLKQVEKIEVIDGKKAFDLYQTFGFPYEVTEELFRQKGQQIDKEEFRKEFEKHQSLSRTASAGIFKGGLADESEIVTKYHTATHLLHQALREILGPQVFQKGSNITSERLRFDFSFDRKMTEEEIKQVEDLVNEKIKEDLPVTKEILSKEEALKSGALGFFAEKYGDKVTIYSIGDFSKEICGGPHVSRTGVIGKIKITKEEAVSFGIRRIRAEIVIT